MFRLGSGLTEYLSVEACKELLSVGDFIKKEDFKQFVLKWKAEKLLKKINIDFENLNEIKHMKIKDEVLEEVEKQLVSMTLVGGK